MTESVTEHERGHVVALERVDEGRIGKPFFYTPHAYYGGRSAPNAAAKCAPTRIRRLAIAPDVARRRAAAMPSSRRNDSCAAGNARRDGDVRFAVSP